MDIEHLRERANLIKSKFKEYFREFLKKRNILLDVDYMSNILEGLSIQEKQILKYFVNIYKCHRNFIEKDNCSTLPITYGIDNNDNQLFNYLLQEFTENRFDFHTRASRPNTARGGFYKQKVVKVIRKY
jgi:hypothetical protein